MVFPMEEDRFVKGERASGNKVAVNDGDDICARIAVPVGSVSARILHRTSLVQLIELLRHGDGFRLPQWRS